MKKHLGILMTVTFLLSVSVFSVSAFAGSKKGWPKVMSIGTTPPGTSYYNLAIPIADVLKKKHGLRITVEGSAGSGVNYELYRKGNIELSMQNSLDAVNWYKGTGQYQKKGKIDVRLLATGHLQAFGMWVKDQSSVRRIDDIKGKRCAFAVPAVPIMWLTAKANMRPFGLAENDIELVKWSGYKDVKSFVAEGTAEVFHTPTNAGGLKPHPVILEISQTNHIRFLQLSKPEQNTIVRMSPFLAPMTIPAGTYRGQDFDLRTTGTTTSIGVKTGLPADLVYLMTKTIWENLDTLKKANAGFNAWYKDKAASFHGIPYHKGAVKYYREIGIWTSAMDEEQQNLLQ